MCLEFPALPRDHSGNRATGKPAYQATLRPRPSEAAPVTWETGECTKKLSAVSGGEFDWLQAN